MSELFWAILGAHSGIQLVPFLPRTILRLARALAPSGMGVANESLLAFGSRDLRIRPWYLKIARDLHQRGRSGFVWDDGFGTPMGVRFYNNTLTFWLYRHLGTRGYTVLSIILFMSGILIPALLESQLPIAAALGLVLLGSPIFLAAQVHMGKPEVLWWAFLAPLLYAALRGHWLIAGILFSIVAIGSFAAAFLIGVAMLFLLLAFWPGLRDALLLGAGMLPGLLKTFIRLIPFFRARLLGSITSEQADAAPGAGHSLPARLKLLVAPDLVLYGFFFFTAVFLAVRTSPDVWRFVIMVAGAWAVYTVGQKLFYLNDPQSFWLWHVALLCAMVLINASWMGVLAMAVFSFMHPIFLGMPVPLSIDERGLKRFSMQGRRWRDVARDFPYIHPIAREPVIAPLLELFADVPAGTRILLESHSHSRDMGGYRTFLQMCDELPPQRNIELLPDEYARIYTMAFFQDFIARFNEDASEAQLEEITRTVGASFVLAYSPAFIERLRNAGFSTVATLEGRKISASVSALLELPPRELVLLRNPFAAGIVTPAAAHSVDGSSISWMAAAGQPYTVRYTYYPEFDARQGTEALRVEPEPAAPHAALQFMTLRALNDGPVTLRFSERWL